MPEISVVICTHNPRMDYLERVLEALRLQTFPKERWELLLIDNNSEEALDRRIDLEWHPTARVVREEALGLTRARLRGIKEAIGTLIVFVDDDNVLEADYLETAISVAERHPNLGVWSGQVLPEFEVEPPKEIVPFLGVLCIRELAQDVWSNSPNPAFLPFGAGMAVREIVARAYAEQISSNKERLALDRSGSNLASSGDLDLAMTSIDLDMGTGLFKKLRIRHLISAKRLSSAYILKLIEDSSYGHEIFLKQRGVKGGGSTSRIDKLVAGYKLFMASPMQKAVAAARERGAKRAASQL